MEKIKQFFEKTLLSEKGKDILVVFILILVGTGSFELGRLSKGSNGPNSPSGVKIEYKDTITGGISQEASSIKALDDQTPVSANSTIQTKTFFASSKGTKYYSPGCTGGQTIKPENKIYFTSKEQAEGAGYVLSTTCR